MNRMNKRHGRLLVGLLSVLFIAPAALGQSGRFHGHKEFLRYTANLPAIDTVELFSLKEGAQGQWDGEIEASKILKGAKAQKIASLWRRQTFNTHLSACHNPGYAVKFYSKGKLLAYASVCWSCNSIRMIKPDLERTQAFEGYSPRGEQLEGLFSAPFAEASATGKLRP